MDFDDDATSGGSPAAAPATVIEVDDYDGPPLSPVSERYRLKRVYLQEKFNYVHLGNNRLRNRLYHVKKEINHLKRLKRILCQRLLLYGDRFMDSYLEIPDNEPSVPGADKAAGDVVGKPTASRKRRPPDSKRIVQTKDFSTMEEKAKNSILSIIDSVITESHEERMRAKKTPNFEDCLQDDFLDNPSTSAQLVEMTEVDSKWMTERMLRPSSIDHLLPMEPDADPDDVLTGFGENLEENFMASD